MSTKESTKKDVPQSEQAAQIEDKIEKVEGSKKPSNEAPKGTVAIERVTEKGKQTAKEELISNLPEQFEMDRIDALAERVVASGIGGHKKKEDAVVAILMGRDLGLPPTVALNNIYSIEGRGATGIHVMTALCIKGGVTYEVLEDFTPVYTIFVKGADGKPLATRTASLEEIKEFLMDGEKPKVSPDDYRTTIKLRRMIKQPDGSWREMTFTSIYKYSTAAIAGLTTKANWKYRETMMLDRALSKGYRAIAADLVFNMQEIGELADAKNIEYGNDAQGHATFDIQAEEV